MLKRTGLGATLIICLAALIAAQQPTNTKAPARPPTLTALDYIEIQQLVNRYGWALDSGADNGYAYADLYAPDAIFTGTNQGPAGRSYQGRDRLAALAQGGRQHRFHCHHHVSW